tara:strand:+ start:109 stop:354 length:246 start_codon:yes stop_codon:yes gene_type:complete
MVLGAIAKFLVPLVVDAIGNSIGKGQGGYVEKDGVYNLHKGEIVIRKADADKILKAYKKHQLKLGDKDKLEMKKLKPYKPK